jgi:hypothetical protein
MQNPLQITNKRLSEVNHNYRRPLRQSQILIKDGILILKEPICGSSSYTHLQLVPWATGAAQYLVHRVSH